MLAQFCLLKLLYIDYVKLHECQILVQYVRFFFIYYHSLTDSVVIDDGDDDDNTFKAFPRGVA